MKKLEIFIYNFTSAKIFPKINYSFFKKNTEKTIKIIRNLTGENILSVSLIFVSILEMKRLNKYWRKENKPTPVLTFSNGDIFLCLEEIRKKTKRQKLKIENFLHLLLVHSILHLLGYTHQKEKNARKMEALEQKIISLL